MTQPNYSGEFRKNGRPNVKAMTQQLDAARTQATTAFDRYVEAENIRYCKWPDQDASGRKPDIVDDKRASPWPGASDVRIRLADEITQARVRLMKKAARAAKLTARGTEGTDFAAAGKVQIYLDHLRDTKIKAEVCAQNQLAAQLRETFGYALTAITWKQEWERVYETVTLEELQQQAAVLPAAAQLLALIASPKKEDRKLAAAILTQMHADLTKEEAYRQVQAMRTTGEMQLPSRRLRENRPSWEALKVWRDVFVPLNCPVDIQAAPWIAWRQTLTKVQLQERVLSEGWAQEFVDAVLKTCGKSIIDQITTASTSSRRRDAFVDSGEEMRDLHEVFSFFYREVDEQGVPCVYRTVVSPHLGKSREDPTADLFGVDGPLGYEHGKYPFIPHRAEIVDSMLIEARGVPEAVATNQQEIKWQRDARIDQTDLNLRPPLIRPEREVGLPLAIEPMGEIGERRMQALRPLTLPAVPAQSPALESDARRDADRYFARNRAEDPVAAGLADQDLADEWCDELAEGWRMTLQLAQQFESEVEFARLVGGRPTRFNVTREEIQGQHDIKLFFNTDTLDPEKMKAKVQLIQASIAPMDRGTIDWAPVVRGLFSYYLPEFADLALRDDQQTTQAEIRDEMNNWALILSGTEPEMAEQGQNFQLRLQWLEGKMEEPGAIARLNQLPDAEAIAQRRLQHLRFMVQQTVVNRRTGLVGVEAPGASLM